MTKKRLSRLAASLVAAVSAIAAAVPCSAAGTPCLTEPDAGVLGIEKCGDHGPAIIFLPSLAGGPWVWQGLDQKLSDRHTIYSMTFPGFDGRHDVSSPAIEKILASLAQFIVSAHLDHPILVGHSLGGFVAYKFSITHPDLVGGLVAVDGFPVFPPAVSGTGPKGWQMSQNLANTFEADHTPEGFHAAIRTFLEQRMNDPAKAAQLAALAGRSNKSAVIEYIQEMVPEDLRPDLPKITAPVLAIVAENSYNSGMKEADIRDFYSKMLAGIPNHKITIIPNARHFVMIDQPELVSESIQHFLNEHEIGKTQTAPMR